MPAMVFRTPIGWLWAVSREGKLIGCALAGARRAAAEREAAALAPFQVGRRGMALGTGLDELARRACGGPARPGVGRSDELLGALAADLGRYFSGEPVDFTRYPVDLSGQPPFYRRALLAACEIPYGEARSYGWLAARAGNPRAARAAGQAMAHNPIGLVIPCHRVIASGGGLGGFGGGLGMKRALLELEGVRLL